MPPSVFDDPALQQAKAQSQQATGAYNKAATSATTLPDMLRDALTKKFTTDNPLYAQRESALGNYLNTNTQAPIDYTHTSAGGNSPVIYNPMQQQNLIQAKRTNALTPLTTLNDLLAVSTGGIDNLVESTGRASQGILTGLKGNADLARTGYTDTLNELSQRADEAYKNAQLAQSAGGGNTAAGRVSVVLQTIANEVKKGATLDQMMRRFGTNAEVTPDDILRVYNMNAKTPAKESAEFLSQKYGVKSPPAALAREQIKKQTGVDLIGQISTISQDVKNKTGSKEANSVLAKQNFPLGIGKTLIRSKTETDLSNLESLYFGITQAALTAIQGTRPSDYDVKSYQRNLGPSIQNPPEVNQNRINNLLQLMGGGGESVSIGGDWE